MKTLSCEEELNDLGIMSQRRKRTVEEGYQIDQVEQVKTRVQEEAEVNQIYNRKNFTEQVISDSVHRIETKTISSYHTRV